MPKTNSRSLEFLCRKIVEDKKIFQELICFAFIFDKEKLYVSTPKKTNVYYLKTFSRILKVAFFRKSIVIINGYCWKEAAQGHFTIFLLLEKLYTKQFFGHLDKDLVSTAICFGSSFIL